MRGRMHDENGLLSEDPYAVSAPGEDDADGSVDASKATLEEGSNRVRLNWDGYMEDIQLLAERIQGQALGCSSVVGIEGDGVIPAFLIAKIMGIDYVDGPRALSGMMHGDRVLAVASVVGKGTRLMPYRHQYKTAAVYVRPRGAFLAPDVILHQIDHWVVLPWEP